MKYLIALFTLILPAMGQAQLSGEIIYEEKINIHKRIPEDRADMKEFIPEFRTRNRWFSYLMRKKPSIKSTKNPNGEVADDVDMSPNKGRRFGFRNMRSNHILYQNYQEDERVEQREFMDKKFLITGGNHICTRGN